MRPVKMPGSPKTETAVEENRLKPMKYRLCAVNDRTGEVGSPDGAQSTPVLPWLT